MNLLVFNLKTDVDNDVLGFTTEWINGLAARCERVYVITMSAGQIAVAPNVKVFSVGKERNYSEPRRAIEFYRLLIRLLQTECIDVCFAHMMPLFAIMGWPLLRIKGISIVLWYAHGHVPFMLRIAEKLVDCIATSSNDGCPIQSSKIHVIGQGVNVARFHPDPAKLVCRDQFVLLTVGRISPIKRIDLLIKSLPIIPRCMPDGRKVIARFIGKPLTPRDHHYSEKLHQLAKELGTLDRVEFLPPLPFGEVERAYQEADLLVNSSDTDSIDKTVLEAMSTALPVITSNAAFKNVFEPEQASFCQIPKGDEKALADSLNILLKMSAIDRQRLGTTLRETVQRNHSLDALVSRLMKLFKDLR